MLGRHVGHDSCCCSAVSQPANGLSKLVSAMGRCGRSFVLGCQYATLEIRGAVLGRHVGHDSCCCSAVSEPANGLSELVSAIGRCGISFVFLVSVRDVLNIRGAALGRHVGHDSCCCSAVSEPANGLSKLVSAIGRCGISFVFFGASVRDVRDSGALCWEGMLGTIPAAVRLFRNQPMDSQSWFLQWVGVQKLCFFRVSVRNVRDSGRCAGKACWARFLLLFGCPANGLSKLASAMGRCGRSFVFLRRQYATLEIRGPVLGRHVGHDSWLLFGCFAASQWTLKAGFCNG